MAMSLSSSAFDAGGSIPVKYTCKGADISPALRWKGAPEQTVSFALICDDPDAPVGTWDHWVLYNIPAETTELPEGNSPLPQGARLGKNSWSRQEYGGPCPPSGTHRYFFRLYALDRVLDLPPGADKQTLLQAMAGHILGQAEVMGTFSKD